MSIPVAASVQIDAVNLPGMPFIIGQSVGPYLATTGLYVIGENAADETAVYKSSDGGLTWTQVATLGLNTTISVDSAISGDTIWITFSDDPLTFQIAPFDCSTDTLGAPVTITRTVTSNLPVCVVPFGSNDAVAAYNDNSNSPGSKIRLESYSGSISLDVTSASAFGELFELDGLATDGTSFYVVYDHSVSGVGVTVKVATITGGVVSVSSVIDSYISGAPRVIALRPIVWHGKLLIPAEVDSATGTTVTVYFADTPIAGAFTRSDLDTMALSQIGPSTISVNADDQLALFWVRDLASIQYSLTSDPASWPTGSLFYDQSAEIDPQRSLSGGALSDGSYGLLNVFTPAAGPHGVEFFIGSGAGSVLAYCF